MTPAHQSVIDMKQMSAYSSAPAAKLTPKQELFKLEEDIELHWITSAAKLQIIKDKELWRADGYTSWKDYCKRRWHKSRSTMYQLLDDAKVAQDVQAQVEDAKPSDFLENGETVSDYSESEPVVNQAQAHALKKVKPKQRVKVLRAAKKGGKVSARAIAQAAEVLTEENPADTTGHPIPKDNLKFWIRRQEVQDLMSAVSEIRGRLREVSGQSAEKNGNIDPLFAGQGWQAPVANLDSLYYQLSECKPDVVCPNCQGTLKDDMKRECSECRRTGFISSRNWGAKKRSEVKHIVYQVKRHEAACK